MQQQQTTRLLRLICPPQQEHTRGAAQATTEDSGWPAGHSMSGRAARRAAFFCALLGFFLKVRLHCWLGDAS